MPTIVGTTVYIHIQAEKISCSSELSMEKNLYFGDLRSLSFQRHFFRIIETVPTL